MHKAIEIASWFVNNEFRPINSIDGNLKLNKLLYLSQMVSLAEYDRPLFEEDLYAFENGVVVEDIRKYYRNEYSNFIKETKEMKIDFSEEVKHILEITKSLFMDASPDELSNLTHEHLCWKTCYEKSKQTAYSGYEYNKNNSIIDINDFKTKFSCDIKAMKEAIEAFTIKDEIVERIIEKNGVSYYYDPNEVDINDEKVIKALDEFSPQDTAYTLYIDEHQGIVIF